MKDIRRVLAPPGAAFLTQKELAKALNFSEDYVQRLETGRNAFQYHHVKELELLRPKDEANARQFDLLLEELRAAVLASLRSKLGVPVAVAEAETKDHDVGKLDAVEAKVDAVQQVVETSRKHLLTLWDKADRSENKLDGLRSRQHRGEKSIIRAVYKSAIIIALGCIASAVLLVGCLRPSSSGFWWLVSRVQLPDSETGMGERKTGQPMPRQPLPHQATGKCRPGETSLFNGCWFKLADQNPPCLPGYFAYEGACYVPIAADPSTPVGGSTKRADEVTQER